MAKERLYLTAISIHRGVIQVIMPDGNIALYAQRGIKKLTPDEAKAAILKGILEPKVFDLPELPPYISISFEDSSIQGRAVASFNKNVIYK